MKTIPRQLSALAALLASFVFLCGQADAAAQSISRDDLIPIYEIQGDGLSSPMAKQWIDTSGTVTAVTANGYYLQDTVGDGNEATSDGIFVYTHRKPTVEVGNCVMLTRAYVDEFYEKTELSRTRSPAQVDWCVAEVPTLMPVPAARLARDPAELYERYEGMLVIVDDLTGMVQGPTKRFRNGDAEIAFVPEPLAAHLDGGRVFQHEVQDRTALMYVSSALGIELPDLNWGDRIEVGAEPGADDALVGVLDYNFGKYQFLPLPGQTILGERVVPGPDERSVAELAPVGENEYTVCTFNLLGLGRGTAQFVDEIEYADQLHKRALAIAQHLDGCTVIGLQEAGTPEDAENLARKLDDAFGLPYEATAIAGPGTSSFEFPLTNAFLTRSDRVTVLDAELRQGCSRFSYDVKYTPGVCDRGTHALFNRPPLIVELEVRMADGPSEYVTVITNHWKSKGGDETVNVVRRQAQAEHVASLVRERLDAEPEAQVVVLGDLNDYFGSGPVEALRAGVEPPLVHAYDFLSDLDRYTYIYNGASQVLDHILVSANLAEDVSEVYPIRLNADYAYPTTLDPDSVQHSSDHDPVLIRVRPGQAAWLGGELTFGDIGVELVDREGTAIASTTTDDEGNFRLWNVEPGQYTIYLDPPDPLLLDQVLLPVDITVGENWLADVDVRHHVAELAAATALAPALSAAQPDE